MAFNINAQVILSGPKNIKAVTNKIQKQLSGLTATVNIKIPQGTGRSISALNNHISKLNANLSTLSTSSTTTSNSLKSLGTNLKAANTGSVNLARSQGQVNTALKGTNNQLKAATSNMQAFGQESARAIKRFGAFTIATGTVFGFIRAVQTATKEALNFERELVKLEQITGKGGKALDDIRKTVDQLSNSLGVDANEILKVGKTFAQTGQTLQEVKRSMDAVARSSLAPTFGTMASTTEGLIAAMAQFNIQARDSEKVLGSLNAVSKRFAVESSDLISAVRRAGGVFAATANQTKAPIDSLNELISIFTAVRSTTRETADTIATGLRTIFSRIQRPRTIEFLKQFNIELLNTQGNFIGTFESFQALSKGLQTVIRQGDVLTLARITEELGGIRQVGKLIPAIKNFEKALTALDVARQGALGGLQQDVDVALRPLGRQFDIVAAQFKTFIREVSESRTFQRFARVALETASAFIKVADSLRPLIPLVATLASIKIAKGAFAFGRGFVTEFRRGGGAGGAGSALGGGITGGGGGGSAQQVVAQQSATRAMNSLSAALKSNSSRLGTNSSALGGVGANLRTLTARVSDLILALRTSGGGRGGGGIVPLGGRGPRGGNPPGSRGRRPGPLRPFMRARGFAAGGTVAEQFPSRTLQKRIYRGRDVNALRAGSMYNAKDRFSSNIRRRNYASRIPQGFQGSGTQLSPNKFEQYVALLNNSVVTGGNAPLDIVTPGGRGIEVRRRQSSTSDTVARDKTLRAILTGQLKAGIKGKFTAGTDRLTLPDIQVAQSAGSSITGSAAQRLGIPRQRRRAIRRAAGGTIFQPQGTDTVPAMLTPGEFVINRASAQRIGYGNLESMNRLAKGGVARSSKLQYFNTGSGRGITPTFGPRSLNSPTTLATTFNKSTVAINKGFTNLGGKLETVTSLFACLAFALSGADFTSLSAFTQSVSQTLPTLALFAGPQLLQAFTSLATQGGKAASAFGLLSGPAGIGRLVALLADPIVSGVTSIVAGSLDQRLDRRSKQPGGLAEAELTGAVEGAFTRGLQAGGIGAVIGTAIAGPVGAAVGGAIGVVAGALEGALSGGALEREQQQQINLLKIANQETQLLNKSFENIIKSGNDVPERLVTLSEISASRRQDVIQQVRDTQLAGLSFWERPSSMPSFAGASSRGFAAPGTRVRTAPVSPLDRPSAILSQQQSAAAAFNNGADLITRSTRGLQFLTREIAAQMGIRGQAKVDVSKLERQKNDVGELAKLKSQAATLAIENIVGNLYKDLADEAGGQDAERLGQLSDAVNKISVRIATNAGEQAELTFEKLEKELESKGFTDADIAKYLDAAKAIQIQTLATEANALAAVDGARKLRAFKLAFEIFGNSIDQEISHLGLAMNEGVASIADLSKSVLEMRNIPFRSVVRNLETSSASDIDKAVKGVASVTGDSSAFANVHDLLNLRKGLPDILKSVVNTVAVQSNKQQAEAAKAAAETGDLRAANTEVLVSRALSQELQKQGGVDANSEVIKMVQTAIELALVDRIKRQGGERTPQQVVEQDANAIITSVFETMQPMLDGFAKVEDALNTYKSNLLLIGNEQLKLSRQQVANDLELNKRRFDISDRANRVLGRPERRGLARGRLDAQLRAIVGSPDQQDALRKVPGGGVRIGGAGTAGRLLQQRTDLEAQRKELKDLLQEADKNKSSEAAENLKKNTDALERNKKALNMLADDVTVLADLEQQAARVSRQEQNAQAGILGLSGATDQLLTGTREGFEAFTSFTEPLNALIRASHNQVLRPDEARGLIEGIQGGDPVLSTLLDALPGGADQARELKQNLVRNLAQDTAMKLSKVGGAPGTFAQLLPIFEKAYTTALDRKTGIAGEIEEIGRDQNRILTENMRKITEEATLGFGKMTTNLDETITKIGEALRIAADRLSAKTDIPPEPQVDQAKRQGQTGLELIRMLYRSSGRMRDFDEFVQPRSRGGRRDRYANGGYVRGPSHGAGGVMANLEGGEYVVPKKYAKGGVVYLQNGGGGPSFSNFWENFKYQFGFGSPETIKRHQEASRGVYTGGGGLDMITPMGPAVVPQAAKGVGMLGRMLGGIKNLGSRIWRGGGPRATTTVAKGGRSVGNLTRSAGNTSRIDLVPRKQGLLSRIYGRTGDYDKVAKRTVMAPQRWTGDSFRHLPRTMKSPIPGRTGVKGAIQTLAEGPGRMTNMDKLTWWAGAASVGTVRKHMLGPAEDSPVKQWLQGSGSTPTPAAIQARQKLGGAAPVEAPTRVQQAYAGQLGPTVRKLIDLGTKRKTIAAATERSQDIQDQSNARSFAFRRSMGTHQERMDDIERRREAVLAGRSPGLAKRPKAVDGSMRAMRAGGKTPAEVADELKRRMEAIDIREQVEAMGGGMGGAGMSGGMFNVMDEAVSDKERAQRADEIQAQKRNNAKRRRERLARRKRRSEPGGMIGIEDRVNRLLGSGRGRQAAAYRGGLTVEQKEEIQRKRRQKLQDARARQQARQDAELKRQNAASEDLKKTSSTTTIMTARGPTTPGPISSETVGGHTTYRTGRNTLIDPDLETDALWSRGTTRTGKWRKADVSSKEQRRPGVKRRGQRGLPYGHPQEETPFKEWKKARDRQKAEKKARLADRTHILRMEKVREQDQNIGRRAPLSNEQGPRGPHAYSQVSKLQRRRGTSPYSQVSKGQQSYHRRRGASPYSQVRRGQQRYHRRRARGYAAGGMALPGQMMDMQQQAFGSLAGSASSAFGGLYGAHAAGANFNPFAFNPASMFALTGGYNTPFGTVGGGQFQNPGYTYNLAGGGSVFKPKGTATVPAMLTPGEYVIQKRMVDHYGEEFVKSINEGTFRGMNYAQKGGKVSRPQYLYNGGSPEAQATAVVENEADMGRLASALTNSIEPLNRLAAALEGFNSSPKDLSLNITGQQTSTVVMGPKVPQEIAQIAKTEVQQNAAGLMRADGSGPDNSLQNLPS